MATSDIGLIAKAVEAGAKVWYQYLVSADKRKAEACKKAGFNYIQVNEKEGEFKNISLKRRRQLLGHFMKRFYHYM